MAIKPVFKNCFKKIIEITFWQKIVLDELDRLPLKLINNKA